MSNYQCLKGWILAPSPTDGSYVPYFIKVRSQDVVWENETIPEDMTEIISTCKNVTAVKPSSQLKFEKDGWTIVSNADYSFEAMNKISIGDSGFVLNPDNDSDLYLDLELPFKIEDDLAFNVQCTLNAIEEDVATATTNVVYETNTAENSIDTIAIHLRNLIYKFDPEFMTKDSYLKSYIYVSVKGKIHR